MRRAAGGGRRAAAWDDGVFVVDDSTLDESYTTAIELVTLHWSGKHHVVKGINLLAPLWVDGGRHVRATTASTARPAGRAAG